MRLAWIFLLVAFAAVHVTLANPPSTEATTDAPDTTTPVVASTAAPEGTTSSGGEASNEPPATPGSTVSSPTDATEPTEPNPDGEQTDETEATGQTKKTTVKVVATSTVTTTTKKAAGTTTTKEPAPDVESFTVTCDKNVPAMCTYTMQVPGLDIDTYNGLIEKTNDTQSAVDDFEYTDFINLQEGVTQVFADAEVTNDYIDAQLKEITQQIKDLDTASNELSADIVAVSDSLLNANYSLTKILNKKGSCLYRQCVLKETTTTKQPTTTTTKPPVIQFCERPENKNTDGSSKVCEHGGTCKSWYDSYYCECVGNLDGQYEDCKTSVCDAFKDPQPPGLVVSPGYYNETNPTDDVGCDDGAQWTIKGIKTGTVFSLKESEADFKVAGNTYISKLSSDANLQLTVGKYKLKITTKTKWSQITQILGYGATATISYSGPLGSYFHFTITEIPAPVTTPATPGK